MFKFRGLLQDLATANDPRVKYIRTRQAFHRLMDAIYLHVLCVPPSHSFFKTEFPTAQLRDQFILHLIFCAVEYSLQRPLSRFTSREELSSFLSTPSLPCFFFHFDDVGVLEYASSCLGAELLCSLWEIAEILRSSGHFFVLTGRSTLLRHLGRDGLQFPGRPQLFRSPNPMVSIPLELLTRESIVAIFHEHDCPAAVNFIDRVGVVDAVLTLTAGIPRAVTTILEHVMLRDTDSVDVNSLELQHQIQKMCGSPFAAFQDVALGKMLFEFAWAEMVFDMESTTMLDEPMSSAIARLGGYTKPAPGGAGTQFAVVAFPLFQYRAQHWSPRSLCAISEYDNPGARLEAGFRRVLHFRLALQIPPRLVPGHRYFYQFSTRSGCIFRPMHCANVSRFQRSRRLLNVMTSMPCSLWR